MLKRRQRTWPWLVAVLLVALVVGSLFQAYAATGVGFFRMFATIGLVFVGFFATRFFYALQENDALDRLHAALAELPESMVAGAGISLPHPDGKGRLVVDLTVLSPRAIYLIKIDATRQSAFKRSARQHLLRSARTLWQAQKALTPRLDRFEEPPPLQGLIVSLFRDPRLDTDGHPTVDGLPVTYVRRLAETIEAIERDPHLHGLPERKPLAEKTYRQLRAALANAAS